LAISRELHCNVEIQSGQYYEKIGFKLNDIGVRIVKKVERRPTTIKKKVQHTRPSIIMQIFMNCKKYLIIYQLLI
jgi:hypothetical protein